MRKVPYAVYLRNIGDVGRGREVLYNPAKHDDKVHAIVGEGDSRAAGASARPARVQRSGCSRGWYQPALLT
jgi:hypothetical protein